MQLRYVGAVCSAVAITLAVTSGVAFAGDPPCQFFVEHFDDAAFAVRGWYDNTALVLSWIGSGSPIDQTSPISGFLTSPLAWFLQCLDQTVEAAGAG